MAAIKSLVGEERPPSDRHRKQAGTVTKDIQLGGIARDAAQDKLAQTRLEAPDPGAQGRENVRDAAHSLAQYVAERRSRRR